LVVEFIVIRGETDVDVSLIGIEREEVFEDFGDLADVFMLEDLVHDFKVVEPVAQEADCAVGFELGFCCEKECAQHQRVVNLLLVDLKYLVCRVRHLYSFLLHQ
jgi:hypothetical protein